MGEDAIPIDWVRFGGPIRIRTASGLIRMIQGIMGSTN